MALSKKIVREITGFTFLKTSSDIENWFNRACSFNTATKLLSESLSEAYFYNAGLSIELLLKTIILAQSKTFETNHKLNGLCENAGIKLTKDQTITLDLFSEIIIWSGRYPTPKNEGQWNNYHDSILEKHIVREQNGNTFKTLAHSGRFPSLENYLKIWNLCESEYQRLVGSSA